MRRFSKNLLANYASTLYVALLGIFIVPLYVDFLGVEAFALVGFFSMIQVFFNLLDGGVSGALSREASRFLAGVYSFSSFIKLVNGAALIVALIALFAGCTLFLSAFDITEWWFNPVTLTYASISQAVELIAVVVTIRIITVVFRAALSGLQEFVLLAKLNSILSSIKFIGVIPIMLLFGKTLEVFFSFQVVVAFLELLVLSASFKIITSKFRRLNLEDKDSISYKAVAKFALGVLTSNALWVLVSQSDRAIVSKLLSLENFGYYAIAVTISSGLMMAIGPLTGVLTPKLTQLVAQYKHQEALHLYCYVTKMFILFIAPIIVVAVWFAEQIMYLWTGDMGIVNNAANVFRWHLLGLSLMLLGAFPYCLIVAKGLIKLHILGSILFALVIIPCIFFLTKFYGLVGPGYAWAGTQFIFLILWVPFVHRKLYDSLNKLWLKGVVVALFPSFILTFLLSQITIQNESRLWLFFLLSTIVFMSLALTFLYFFILRKTKLWSNKIW